VSIMMQVGKQIIIEMKVMGVKIMQAYEGYLEDGRFFPFGAKADFKERQRVIVTVLGDEKTELRRQAEAMLFAELEKAEKTEREKGLLSEEEADALIAKIYET